MCRQLYDIGTRYSTMNQFAHAYDLHERNQFELGEIPLLSYFINRLNSFAIVANDV